MLSREFSPNVSIWKSGLGKSFRTNAKKAVTPFSIQTYHHIQYNLFLNIWRLSSKLTMQLGVQMHHEEQRVYPHPMLLKVRALQYFQENTTNPVMADRSELVHAVWDIPQNVECPFNSIMFVIIDWEADYILCHRSWKGLVDRNRSHLKDNKMLSNGIASLQICKTSTRN